MEASYDIQSLFGELGGTIGLTLGLCFLGILEIMLFHFVQNWKQIGIRITTFLLLIPLAYYVVTSCFKYSYEPISTVVSFTKGNARKEFPYLTFCPASSNHFQGGSFHHDVERDFMLINNSTFNVEDYVWFLSYNVSDIISDPFLSINGNIIYMKSDNIWSEVYHKMYGLCYTLDIRSEDALLNAYKRGPITFGCKPKRSGTVLMHNHNDLLAADGYSSILDFSLKGNHSDLSDVLLDLMGALNDKQLNNHYVIRKRKLKSVLTKDEPCELQNLDVCKDIELYEKVRSTLNCTHPLLFSGNHIEKTVSLPQMCSKQEILKAFDVMRKTESNCKKVPQCQYDRYLVRSVQEANSKTLEITLDENMETHDTFITYRLDNLFGEAGGTAGAFVGWSAWSILSSFFDFNLFSKFSRLKGHIRKVTVIGLLMTFVYWSFGIVLDYNNGAETMYINLQESVQAPYLTICSTEFSTHLDDTNFHMKFITWFHEQYPCSRNHFDYMLAVKACLESSENIVDALLEYEDINLPNITLFTNNDYMKIESNAWTKVFHSKIGVCYTMESDNWQR